MRQTDVVIVGGGLAGSTAAAMLGRAGIDAILVDPHKIYPPDFRCEKLDRTQVHTLRKTGLADEVLGAATFSDEVWIVRDGDRIAKRRTRAWPDAGVYACDVVDFDAEPHLDGQLAYASSGACDHRRRIGAGACL